MAKKRSVRNHLPGFAKDKLKAWNKEGHALDAQQKSHDSFEERDEGGVFAQRFGHDRFNASCCWCLLVLHSEHILGLPSFE